MNRLIERKGPKLGLIVTEGFEDTTLIGTGNPVGRRRPGEASAQHRSDRTARTADPEGADRGRQGARGLDRGRSSDRCTRRTCSDKIQFLVDEGVRGFVVVAAVVVPQPSARAAASSEIIEQEYHPAYLGAMPVFLSSDVAPRIYEYPRTMMTVLNAYLHQSMYEELSGIGDELRERGYRQPMMMIHNTGGMASRAAYLGGQHLQRGTRSPG